MPTNKNAFQRYVYLDPLLADRKHFYDIYDITERVNSQLRAEEKPPVSVRTIQKDIKDLEGDPFYIELERYPVENRRCIRYKDNGLTIFNKELTEDERNLLREVLKTLGQFEGLDHLSWFDDMRTRLDLSQSDEDPIIQFDTNPRSVDSNLLGGLFTAIANKQVIRVYYRTFDGVMERNCVVHPYLLRQFNTRWYVFGADDGDDFLLHFALDRMTHFEVLPTAEYRPCHYNLVDRFEDIVGVTLNRDKDTGEPLPCEDVLFWVNDNEIGYVETRPIHGSQKTVNGEKEQAFRTRYPHLRSGRFYSLEVIPNRELLQAFACYFGGLEILEPVSLRKEFTQMITETYSLYKL